MSHSVECLSGVIRGMRVLSVMDDGKNASDRGQKSLRERFRPQRLDYKRVQAASTAPRNPPWEIKEKETTMDWESFGGLPLSWKVATSVVLEGKETVGEARNRGKRKSN